jgi:hypothetical protein
MSILKYFFLLAFFSIISFESQAQLVSIRIGRPAPPPPPRHYAYRPSCPGPDYVWHDGRWSWDDYVRDYVWVGGFWEYVQPRCEPQTYYRSKNKGRGRGRDRDYDRDRNYDYSHRH